MDIDCTLVFKNEIIGNTINETQINYVCVVKYKDIHTYSSHTSILIALVSQEAPRLFPRRHTPTGAPPPPLPTQMVKTSINIFLLSVALGEGWKESRMMILIFHHNLQRNSLKILQCDFLDFFSSFCPS